MIKSGFNKVCAKLRSPFNVNITRFLNKERISESLHNVSNVQKTHNKGLKLDLFVPKKKYNSDYESEEKIGIAAYSLLSIPIGAFILGTWQIQRRQWKVDLIEKLKTNTKLEPVELPTTLEDLKSIEYYPIKVRGTFLYDKEFIVGFRGLIIDGKPAEKNAFVGTREAQRGYHVVTPFKLADRDLTILVNRGWVPRSHKKPERRQKYQIKEETEIVGILRLNEERPRFVPKNRPHSDMWYYRDVELMAKQSGTTPIYLEMISNNFDQYPIGNQTKVELRNEHFSYILTWYCLSAATAYMWYRKMIRKIPFAQ